MPFILEAVAIVRRELRPDQAVIGFCGGPFTVAGYLIEGKPSREFLNVKRMMYAEPATWHALMEKLTDAFSRYVRGKVRAGADVIQLFDSWVGALSPADYEEFVQPYSARILAAVDCPTIHFGTGTATLLEQMRDAGGDVIGLDWRIPLDWGWQQVGDDRGVQGNLDGAVLLGPWERVEAATLDVLARAAGRPGHIFNLGHGVMPDTDPDVLGRLRAFVHEQTAARSCMSSCGRPDGVRLAGPARGRPGLLRRHPRRPADLAGEPRGSRRPLPPARDRGVEPAERDHRGDARCARGRARNPRLHRHASLAAADRRLRSSRRSRAARTSSSASSWRRTTRRCRSSAIARSSSTHVAGRAEIRFVERWGAEPGFVDLIADRVRGRATRTSSSRRTRCRRGSWSRAIRTGTSCSRRRGSWPRKRAWRSGRSRSRASRRPASPGSVRTSSTTWRRSPRAASARCSSRRSASSPTTSRSGGTSTSRRRSARPSSGSSSTGSSCRTPILPSSACSRGSSGVTSLYRPTVKSAQ